MATKRPGRYSITFRFPITTDTGKVVSRVEIEAYGYGHDADINSITLQDMFGGVAFVIPFDAVSIFHCITEPVTDCTED